MLRTLRSQLIASVVMTLVLGLGASQWIGTRLSERELENDLRERTLLVVETVRSLWERSAESESLRRQLATLVGSTRPVDAIDILELRDGEWRVIETTRSAGSQAVPLPAPEDRSLLAAHEVVRRARGDMSDGWRLAAPLGSTGALAVQMDVRAAGLNRLTRALRFVDVLTATLSVVLLSVALGFLLERRVTRPVKALVRGMRQVEHGDLGTRITLHQGGEFEFLGRCFNSMVSRIEGHAVDREDRVHRATRDLELKNQELLAVNQRLSHAQLEVTRSERLATHGQMATTLAHELGTPLNSVLGYTQLLLRDEPVADRRGKLTVIESQVQRMAQVIHEVLSQVRDQTFERAPVDVEALVAEAVAFVSPRIEAERLTLVSDVAKDVPSIQGDAAALRQVLINLLTNAIDATGMTGVVTVTAACAVTGDDGKRCLELTVRDTGEGMDEERMRRAQEPFFTTKAPGRGTGLGLVIVDRIVRSHQARWLMESEPGKGTTVRVRLPLEA